jgi:hypothetical protein
MRTSILLLIIALTGASNVPAGTRVACDFDSLAEGHIDGQSGWKLYEKVMDSPAFLVTDEVGVTEAAGDNALVVKPVNGSTRCVTDDPVRWLREQTAVIDFDFRLVVPAVKGGDNEPLLIFMLGNSMLSGNARWEVRIDSTANGDWMVHASIPNEVSAIIPCEKLERVHGGQSIVSDWLHCRVEVHKLPTADSFAASAKILDRSGNILADLTCSEPDKTPSARALWNLSRLHAGFLAAKDLRGLSCIDNFSLSTAP